MAIAPLAQPQPRIPTSLHLVCQNSTKNSFHFVQSISCCYEPQTQSLNSKFVSPSPIKRSSQKLICVLQSLIKGPRFPSPHSAPLLLQPAWTPTLCLPVLSSNRAWISPAHVLCSYHKIQQEGVLLKMC